MVSNQTGKIFTERDVAELLQISLSTVRRWRGAKQGPAFIRLPSGSVRYRPEDVQAWIDSGQRKAG